jgi:hypothetical protein
VGRTFHVSAAGFTLFGLGCRVFSVLINNEESKESRREFPHSLVRLFGREVVPEDGVFVGACVISSDEFQLPLHGCDLLLSGIQTELVAQIDRSLPYGESRDARKKYLEADDVFVESGEGTERAQMVLIA